MSLLHFRRIERRRTTRVTMCMRLQVQGKTENGAKFKFTTQTVSVSAHGGVLVLEERLAAGQRFQVTNDFNEKKAEARIVSVRTTREGDRQAAFEFECGGEKFWSMTFPAPGAKPLRRLPPRMASGG